MIKRLTDFYFDGYVPHVRHILYPVLMGAAGWKCLAVYDWQGFGIMMLIGASVLFVVVALGIAWRGPIEYWDKIAEAIKALLRAGVTPLEAKKILGLSVPELPDTIKVKEYVPREVANSLPGIRYTEVPATEAVMLNEIANKVILSKSINFTETVYGRKALEYFKEKGYVTKGNGPKAGHRLNHKGAQIVYQFASEAIKNQIEKEG